MSDKEHNIPEELKKYIFYKFGSFAVKNDKNKMLITFGRFSSEEVACAATNLLIKYDWRLIDVSNNPLSEYLDYYYVFKVINNNLIFDSKFESYEQAVEYMEINYRCNEYNNAIFSKKKRKSRFENLPKIQFEDDINIPNIYLEKDLYNVKFNPGGKVYGSFYSVDEAIVAKNLLIENNWQFLTSAEMKFYNSFYWVFKIENNVLFFVNKFKSYEDAIDSLNFVKSKDFKLDKSIESNKKIKEKPKTKVESKVNQKKKKVKKAILESNAKQKKEKPKIKVKSKVNQKKNSSVNMSKMQFTVPRVKHKFAYENIIIKNVEEINKENIKKIVENLKSDLYIIKFKNNVLMDYYSISFSKSNEIGFSDNIKELWEFEYVWRILNVYNWDLDKINSISSIYYFNDFYYILKSFDGKLIISGPFNSYEDAEENVAFLYEFYSKDFEESIPSAIRKHGDYYKFIAERNGKNFEIAYQKSLETLKAIIDIFEHYNWDSNSFIDYNIYYYHGLYWEIDYFNYYIKLLGVFHSKEEAIGHKISSN